MKLIKEFSEHPYIQLLGVFAIIIGYLLDYLGKNNYFSYAIIIGIVIMIYTVYVIWKEKKKYESQEHLPIPIVIKIDSNISSKYVLNNLFKKIEYDYKISNLKENLKKYRNIVEDELVFNYEGDIYNQKKVINFLQIIKYQITKIKENIPNKVQFHIAYYKRPALGFPIGFIFAEDDAIIYQQNPDNDTFDKVAVLEKRNYKSQVKNYDKFSKQIIKTDINSDTVLLGIKASSHQINFNASSLKDYTNVFYMEANHNGTIELEEDWVLYAREIFSLLNELQTKYKSITIVHNMPESIAVILGKAMSNYWNIQITQFDKGEYLNIIKLNDVEYYF
jgi:hypothetical protein